MISNIPAFQKDGQFDPQTYATMLQAQRRNQAGFETQVRDSISNQQFSQAITNAAFIPPAQAKQYQSLQNQLRDVETFTIKQADYSDQVSVSSEEVKEEYDANAKNYMTTEKVKLSYVLLKQEEIAKNLTVEEDALRAFFDENASRYTDPEQRKLAHILVKISEDKKEEAKEKAEALYEQIQSGAKTFEELAVSSSDDKLAAEKNGEIGLISKGEMGVLFDDKAFDVTLLKGATTKVVETEAGFEIIKLLDVIPAKNKPFEEVRAELESLYRSEEAEKLFIEQSDKLQTLSFENDSSLGEAADAVGVSIQSSDWVLKNNAFDEKNVLTSPKVVAAAFSDDVLTAGRNSELIEIDAKTVLVVRLEDHKLPEQKAMADVESNIKSNITANKLKALVAEKGDSALETLSKSGEWSSIESIGATADKVEANVGLKRNDSKLQRTVVEKVFSMQKPESSKSFNKVILPNGDYVLIALSKVANDESEKDGSLAQNYTQALASREQSAVLAALREQAEIKLFPENIQ